MLRVSGVEELEGVIVDVPAKYYQTTYIIKTSRISYLQSYAVDFFHHIKKVSNVPSEHLVTFINS